MQQTGSTTPPAGTPCRPHDEHRAHRAGRVKASNLFRRRYRKIRRRLRRSDQVADSLAEQGGFELLVSRENGWPILTALIDLKALLLRENQATSSRDGPTVPPASPWPAVPEDSGGATIWAKTSFFGAVWAKAGAPRSMVTSWLATAAENYGGAA